MNPYTFWYGVAVAGLCGFTIITHASGCRGCRRSVEMSLFLLLAWFVSNFCFFTLTPDDQIVPMAATDLAGCFVTSLFWYADGDEPFWRRAWLLALSFLFLTDVMLDALFAFNWSAWGHAERHSYRLMMNLTFILQMLATGTPGGTHAFEGVRSLVLAGRDRDRIRSSASR